jgi:hypothetical protein
MAKSRFTVVLSRESTTIHSSRFFFSKNSSRFFPLWIRLQLWRCRPITLVSKLTAVVAAPLPERGSPTRRRRQGRATGTALLAAGDEDSRAERRHICRRRCESRLARSLLWHISACRSGAQQACSSEQRSSRSTALPERGPNHVGGKMFW